MRIATFALLSLLLVNGLGACRDPLASETMVPFAGDAVELGWAYIERNDYATAEKRFRMALRHDMNCSPAYFGLAYIFSKQGNYTEAKEMYEKSLAIEPNQPDAWANLGQVYGREGLVEDAKRALYKALDLDSENQIANYSLAKILSDEGHWSESRRFMVIAIKSGFVPDSEIREEFHAHECPLPE